eukprot:1140333-Pelagomonas_calceolata.AAC.6
MQFGSLTGFRFFALGLGALDTSLWQVKAKAEKKLLKNQEAVAVAQAALRQYQAAEVRDFIHKRTVLFNRSACGTSGRSVAAFLTGAHLHWNTMQKGEVDMPCALLHA